MTGSVAAGIDIEVVFALRNMQRVVALRAEPGATAADAVAQSALAQQFPDHDIASCNLAIFGKPVKADHVLRAGDRVEILRPLKADPKTVRRQLAAQGKTMGRGAS